jgi:hypothetical protein
MPTLTGRNTPWIDTMLTLPAPPRRADLAAFAVASGLVGGLALGAVLGLAVSAAWAALGPALGALLAAVGLLRPGAVAPLYAAFSRLGAAYRGLALVTVKVAAFLAIAGAGRDPDARLALHAPAPDRSLWVPRGADRDGAEIRAAAGLVQSYTAWARDGRRWALILLPFVLLMAAIDTDVEPTLPTQTYTLF